MKIVLIIALSLVLSSCVTTRSGRKKYAPREALTRADETVGKWFEWMGAPPDTAGF